jgi:hypothetical protein
MRTWLPALAAAATAVAVVAVVTLRGGEEAPARPVVVDERRGTLDGIAFGETAAEVRAVRGEPDDEHPGFFPQGVRYTGPPGIPSPRSDQRLRRPPLPLHYGDESYLVSPTVGVFSMATVAHGARTRAGIGIGDDLDAVRERYGRVRCGVAVAGEAVLGGETPTYAWCRALVDDVRVFFGGDPVASITLTSYR